MHGLVLLEDLVEQGVDVGLSGLALQADLLNLSRNLASLLALGLGRWLHAYDGGLVIILVAVVAAEQGGLWGGWRLWCIGIRVRLET